MDRRRIEYEFSKLKEAFPEARITEDRGFIMLPHVKLSQRYNLPSTPVLISFESVPGSYTALAGLPTVYVSDRLLVDGKRPIAFIDPFSPDAPDAKMKRQGWTRLCWKNPPPVENLRTFVASLMLYLKNIGAYSMSLPP